MPVNKSADVVVVFALGPDDWPTLRDARLRALGDSPGAFLANYEVEARYGEREWRELASGRLQWFVASGRGGVIGLVAARRPSGDTGEWYVESMWVAPGRRRTGVARRLLQALDDALRMEGVRTMFLWVLSDNDAARRAYQRLGFVSTGRRQPLQTMPGRTEEQMCRRWVQL
jgi:ribosomal protein S18 acetylase RimI-like enzyme